MATKKRVIRKSVNDYLQELEKFSDGRRCVFRGQADADWPLLSGAERRISIAIATTELSAGTKQRSLENYHTNLLEEARQRGFGILDGRVLDDLEILAKLQHFGAATALLDFTRKASVALYFACIEEPERDGKVYVLPYGHIAKQDEQEQFSKINKQDDLRIWFPATHGEAERRIIAQDGVFLINLKSDYEDMKSIIIKRKDKADVLRELRERQQIFADTLFIDLSGFAQNQSQQSDIDDAWVYFYRGNESINQSLYEEAEEDYNKAIRLKSDFTEAYYNRGFAKYYNEKYKQAIQDFNQAIRLDSKDADSYHMRGMAKSKLERWAKAIDDYDESLKLNPNDPDLYIDRAKAKTNLGQDKEALVDVTAAIRIKPDDAYPYNIRGLVQFKLGRYGAAKRDYSRAIRIDKDYAHAYYNRAESKIFLNQYDEAVKDYVRAFRKSSTIFEEDGVDDDFNHIGLERRTKLRKKLNEARSRTNEKRNTAISVLLKILYRVEKNQ